MKKVISFLLGLSVAGMVILPIARTSSFVTQDVDGGANSRNINSMVDAVEATLLPSAEAAAPVILVWAWYALVGTTVVVGGVAGGVYLYDRAHSGSPCESLCISRASDISTLAKNECFGKPNPALYDECYAAAMHRMGGEEKFRTSCDCPPL